MYMYMYKCCSYGIHVIFYNINSSEYPNRVSPVEIALLHKLIIENAIQNWFETGFESEFNLLNVVNGGLMSGHVHVMVLAHYVQGPLEGGAKG